MLTIKNDKLFYTYIDSYEDFKKLEIELLRLELFWNGLSKFSPIDEKIYNKIKGRVILTKSGCGDDYSLNLCSDARLELIKRANLKEINFTTLFNTAYASSTQESFLHRISSFKSLGATAETINLNNLSNGNLTISNSSGSPINVNNSSIVIPNLGAKTISINNYLYHDSSDQSPYTVVDNKFIKLNSTIQSNRWSEKQLVNIIDSFISAKKEVNNFFNNINSNRVIGRVTDLIDTNIKIKTKNYVKRKLFESDF